MNETRQYNRRNQRGEVPYSMSITISVCETPEYNKDTYGNQLKILKLSASAHTLEWFLDAQPRQSNTI